MSAQEPRIVNLTERNAAIERAKQEWESTADALTSLVCLLNRDGLVLRANRVVVHWNLGSVAGVIGRSAHAVLHPASVGPNCPMKHDLDRALSVMSGGGQSAFEYFTPAGDRTWQFTLRLMSQGSDPAGGYGDAKGVLVVTDISALRLTQLLLEGVNTTLESRVLQRTQKLAEANRELRTEAKRRPLDGQHPARVLGSGLRNLRERAEMTGGRLMVSTPPGGGTAVELWWALADEDFTDGLPTETLSH